MSTPDTRIPEDLPVHVNPLFYDALSKEFFPPSDSQGRAHTIGRLMVAALQKGEIVPNDSESTTVHVRYTPSWASRTEATAFYTPTPVEAQVGHRKFVSIGGLVLQNTDTLEVVSFHKFQSEEGKLGIEIGHRERGEYPVFPLGLGAELSEAREAVAETAQQFFDQLPRTTG